MSWAELVDMYNYIFRLSLQILCVSIVIVTGSAFLWLTLKDIQRPNRHIHGPQRAYQTDILKTLLTLILVMSLFGALTGQTIVNFFTAAQFTLLTKIAVLGLGSIGFASLGGMIWQFRISDSPKDHRDRVRRALWVGLLSSSGCAALLLIGGITSSHTWVWETGICVGSLLFIVFLAASTWAYFRFGAIYRIAP